MLKQVALLRINKGKKSLSGDDQKLEQQQPSKKSGSALFNALSHITPMQKEFTAQLLS